MTDRTCSIPGCEKAHRARGWCSTHYQRWQTYGEPDAPVRVDKISGTCDVPDCETPRKIRQWCRPHYLRWKRYGDPTAGYRSRGAPLPPCAIEGCTETATRIIRGMCLLHYRRWQETGDPGGPSSLRIIGDDNARFWSYVDKDGPTPEHRPDLGPCWEWTGAHNGDGYPSFRVGEQTVGGHRWAWLTFVGPLAAGHEADHLCHNRGCVNFDGHLEDVTSEENKGRARKFRRSVA